MTYAVYETATGRLHSISSSIPGSLPSELDYKDVGPVDISTQMWNESTLNFDQRPGPRILNSLEFMRRFTSEERINIRTAAKTDPVVEDMMNLLEIAASTNGRVNMDDTETINGATYLESRGLIGAGRAAEILG